MLEILKSENIKNVNIVLEEKRAIAEGPFKGFIADHLMAIFYNHQDEIVAISYLTENLQNQIAFFIPNQDNTGFEKTYVYTEDIVCDFIFEIIEDLKNTSEKEEFEKVVKEALQHPLSERGCLFENITLTDVVPGEKCNNGGEYGFYTHLEPTSIIGVFKMWTSCTCDFDLCGTDGSSENGSYVYISSDELDEMIEKSEEIENLGNRYFNF